MATVPLFNRLLGRCVAFVLALLFCAPLIPAQNGDRKGEVQPPLPEDLEIPAAPVLTPEEALAQFRVAPGYRVELVAAEPLLQDPVVAVFDESGRLWVCEMRGYMPNIDGEGELEPIGCVAVLTDEDGDGRMDRRDVFLDGLVLPRAIHPTEGGCLILAPPELTLWTDTDGDGKADTSEVVDTGLGGLDNPEHAINSLLYQVDNWYRMANSPKRYRRVDGEWVIGRTASGGQWGLTQDALGRAYFDTNSDPLRGDLFPSHYALRNPNYGRGGGTNVRIARDMATYSPRVNTGVNRGYQKNTLRDDFTLRNFTAACAPLVVGNDAFVCEPTGNLVKRYRIDWKDGLERSADQFYEGTEFLASMDERFRPVNLTTAPDGSLIIVDFTRGLIQHRIFLTSWLRAQILDRGLDRPASQGRIWRVVDERVEAFDTPDLGDATWEELVRALSHPNAMLRLTAQRLLVEEAGDQREPWELMRTHALDAPEPLGRMHALWALAGTNGLDPEFVAKALQDSDPRVLHAALRVAEPWIAGGDPKLTALAAAVAEGADAGLYQQVLHSLGSAATSAGDDQLAVFARQDCSNSLVRSALLTGLYQRELAFIRRLLSDLEWDRVTEGRPELLRELARCVVRQGIGEEIEALIALALTGQLYQAEAIFEGIVAARPKGPDGKPTATLLGAKPSGAEDLQGEVPKANAAYDALVWPGKPGYEAKEVRALRGNERELFNLGATIYRDICSACHQPSGLGEPGKAPPLRNSPYTLGKPDVFGRILLHGLGGEIKFGSETWNAEMPAYSGSDLEAAAVMTYVRREWGHGAEPVSEAFVTELRAEIADRTTAWTVEEIKALMDD
ncbi:MAG: mono/diheme cytochrome c family protein [Planctomycetota bacterium]|jgi:mono/diheme cytochrome c family protein